MPSPTTSNSTSPVPPSASVLINALIAGNKWGGSVGTGTTVSYSFPWQGGAGATYAGYGGFGNYSTLNEPGAAQHYGLDPVQTAAFQQALQTWAAVANVSFSQLPDSASIVGDIRIAFTSATILTSTGQSAWGWAYPPGSNSPSTGDIWLNAASIDANDSGWAAGSQNYASLLHETGHALGLKHPFEDGAVLPAALDTRQYSLMAYTPSAHGLYVSVTNSGNSWTWSAYNIEPSTPMVYDMQAMQYLYGANTSYNTGDTTYSFDPATPFFKTLWDAGGNDTISTASFTLSCTIDLRQGHFSSLAIAAGPSAPAGLNWLAPPPVSSYDGTDNLAIAFGCVIENATGGSGDDTLQGNSGSNVLNGGAGNDVLIGEGGSDTLIGGGGTDIAVFSGLRAQYSVTRTASGYQATGPDGTSMLTAVSYVQFSDQTALTASLVANSRPAGSVTMSGLPAPGQTLIAANTLTDADGVGAVSYQWQTNGIGMAGATGNTWTITPAQAGQAISVVASYTDGLGTRETLASLSITIVSTADMTIPTVTITDNLPGTANRATSAVTYALEFSEAVTGLEPGDFNITNGTVGTVSGSGSSWTVSVVPALNVASGAIGLTLKAGAVSDAAGNLNAVTASTSQALDTAAPVAPRLITNAAFDSLVNPQVTLQTSLGAVVLDLNPEAAPITVANMLAYVSSGFYDNTLFHRVIPNFMAQGGGFTTTLAYKTPTYSAIPLESNNGLSNLRGTLAMARTSAADSATSQFFVNQVNNTFLNYASAASPGYAVFGSVVAGMSVIDAMVAVPRSSDVPLTDIVITSARQTLAGSSISRAATFVVADLETGAQWSYSLNSGASWAAGSGNSLSVPAGRYAASAIQVRQLDAAANQGVAVKFTSALVVDATAPTVIGFSPADAATGVATGADLTVVFSETIQRGSGSIVLKTADGATVATYDAASSANLGFSGNTLSINPSADLAGSTGYRVELAAGSVKDLAGNGAAASTGYDFTTAAAAPAQTITGTPGADTFTSSAGNDTLDGGAGLDTAVFSARLAAYTLAPATGGYSLSGPDGTDRLAGIERLQFLDASLAFDTDGNAGKVYRLYQAAFDRTPDLAGLGGWIAAMDGGASLLQVATSFIGSAESQYRYGPAPDNAQFITALYLNVLSRAPDAGGYGYWVNQLASGLQTRPEVLQTFSESAENQAALLPVMAGGIAYATAAQAAGPASGQSIVGTAGNDILTGSVGKDTFTPGAGNDSINGGAGIDLAMFSGSRASHAIATSTGSLAGTISLNVTGASDGTDLLTNVERLTFDDMALAFDTAGNAGQAYRLYQAAFDRTPDKGGLSDWLRGMDAGMALHDVATGFIGSAEFKTLYGAAPSNTQFVDLLYANVLNRPADTGGYGYWLGEMQGGMSRETVLIGFSESAENQAALTGVIQGGIEYVI